MARQNRKTPSFSSGRWRRGHAQDPRQQLRAAASAINQMEQVEKALGFESGIDYPLKENAIALFKATARMLNIEDAEHTAFSVPEFSPPVKARFNLLRRMDEQERVKCLVALANTKNLDKSLEKLINNYYPKGRMGKMNEKTGDISRGLSEKHSRASKNALPRWAEENRSNERFQMRISDRLRGYMDDAARTSGFERSAWFEQAARRYFQANPGAVPEEYPDYKTGGLVTLRISSDLNAALNKLTETSGIKKADVVRRLIFNEISRNRLERPSDFNL